MDGGAWWVAVHGVAKSQTRLSDFTFTFHFHALEKEMENPRDRGVWWAAIYGVTQSWTRLKRLSSSSRAIETSSKTFFPFKRFSNEGKVFLKPYYVSEKFTEIA